MGANPNWISSADAIWRSPLLGDILMIHHHASMRTPLTLDPDVARMIEEEVHRRRKPFKAVVNEAIRRGCLRALPNRSPIGCDLIGPSCYQVTTRLASIAWPTSSTT